MDQWIDIEIVQQIRQAVQAWWTANFMVTYPVVQVAVVFLLAVLARLFAPRIRRRLEAWQPRPQLVKLRGLLIELSWALLSLALLWMAIAAARQLEWPFQILNVAASLATAWVVIRSASRLLADPAWSRTIATVAWIIAALNIMNLLEPTIRALDSVSVTMGQIRISPYTVLKSTAALMVLLSLALYVSRVLESRIAGSVTLSPSLKVLMSKSLKMVLITLAVLVAIQSVGINLGALAIFSGAIGLGIGFGLQKIFGNLISGLILLIDKSIKPGDVIAIDDTYGWVNTLGARYASVITRDGVEHLIPNELLITERVENWTHSDTHTRLKVPIGVHYDSDVPQAMELCKQAAAEVDRVLGDPKPNCLLKGFGDSSVDLEIRIWIKDAQSGVANVKSAVLLRVWAKFHEHGVEIPYPQRDLHLRTPEILAERLASSSKA